MMFNLSSYHFPASDVVPEDIRLLLKQALEGRLHDVDAVEGQGPAGRDACAVRGSRVLLSVEQTPLAQEIANIFRF